MESQYAKPFRNSSAKKNLHNLSQMNRSNVSLKTAPVPTGQRSKMEEVYIDTDSALPLPA
jgi:hypothetical protein